MAIDIAPDIPIEYIKERFLAERNTRLGILRLDQLHTQVSGNKWFKLKENVRLAKEGGYTCLLTFGGAYSNHLAATAVAAAQSGFRVIAIVRGWHGKSVSSPTLDFCVQQGMQLHFVSKEEYGLRYDDAYLQQLKVKFDQPYIIPEGGNNEPGRTGCGQIAASIPKDADHVAVAIGTGTTFCGIRKSMDSSVSIHGFPVMKNGDYLAKEINEHIGAGGLNWHLHCQYHFGGFARHTPELVNFMNNFYQHHSIPLDFVYTAKLMFAVFDLIQQSRLGSDTHIIVVHTGGLQGNASIQDRLTF